MQYLKSILLLWFSQVSASATSSLLATKEEASNRKLEDDLCEFKFEREGCGACELSESIVDDLLDTCSKERVMEIFGLTNLDPDKIKRKFTNMCEGARQRKLKRPFPFKKITRKGEMFDQEYFDGGTSYNWHRQTEKFPGTAGDPAYILEENPGVRINSIYKNVAQSENIGFPDYLPNFQECEYNTVMCCFVQDRQANDDNGNCDEDYDSNCVDEDPADNTDICLVDMERSQQSSHTAGGFAIFKEDIEGDTHCHGISWADDSMHPSSKYAGNNLFYVSMFDHFYTRGYVRNVPGAPMCSCLEKSPVVSRADCTEIDCVSETMALKIGKKGKPFLEIINAEIEFNACEGIGANNNLEEHYKRLVADGDIADDNTAAVSSILVGDVNTADNDADPGCAEAITEFVSLFVNESGDEESSNEESSGED